MLPFAFIAFLHCFISVIALSTPKDSDHNASHSDPPQLYTGSIGRIQTRPTVVYKPRSLEALHAKRRRRSGPSAFPDKDLEWDAVEVLGPNVADRHTLAQLARMAGNAYALPGQSNWYEVDRAWRVSFPFGWEEEDGFRGHVFLSSDNNTVVLSIKGTTVQGPTSRLDRFNDNLLFSCCCAKGSWVLKTVCDCFSGRNRCDNQCLTEALVDDSLFYSIGTKLVDDLFRIYPTANLWLVGHSLGGAIASLLGATYGIPAVAFESPGEKMAAFRLNLPLPPPIESSDLNFPTPRPPRPPPNTSPLADYITHVYHTADPIPFGTCSGLYSACATAGYALETKCHLGKSIILDTVNKLRWLVDVRKHVIKEVVRLLDFPEEGGREVDWGQEGGGDDEGDNDPEEPEIPDPWANRPAAVGSVASKVLRSLIGWAQQPQQAQGLIAQWCGWGPGLPGKGKKDKKDKDEDRKISNRVPKPILESDCVDCHRWEFGHFKDEV